MEAEALRLRHQTRRFAVSAVFAGIAIILLVGAMVFSHIAIWYWLRETLTRQLTALILGAGDLLLAVVPALLAARSAPGRVEREAHAVRQQAVDEVMQSCLFSALLVRLVGLFISRVRR